MAVAAIAIAAVVGTAATVATSIENADAAERASNAEKSLANEQAASLKAQQDQAAALAAQQATTGETFGFETQHPLSGVMTGIGFGTAPKTSANEGSKSVTGMG